MGFRSEAHADVSGVSHALTINKPAGVAQGDVMLAFIHLSAVASIITVPSGWSQVGTPKSGLANSLCYLYVKVAGASEPSSYSWDQNQGTAPNDWAGAIVAYSNMAIVASVEVQGNQSNTSSVNAVAPSLTTLTASDTLVVGIFADTQVTTTPPAGMTERLDFFSNWSQYVTLEVSDVALGAAGATGTKTATLSSAQVSVGWAVALRPAVPFAPTLTAPANGLYTDMAAAGATVAWTHNSAAGATQTAYALRRKIAGAGSYEWWNAGTVAWQGTEVFNTSAAGSVVFGAGKWTDGNTYNWSVATQDSGGTGPYSSDQTIFASAPPSVAGVGPAGSVITGTPTVSWTPTVQSGAAQTTYRVVIESGTAATSPGSGTVLWDSGVVSSTATSVPVPTANQLANGTSGRVSVQVQETGGQSSPWAYADFTVAYDTPATPSLIAVWDSTLARAALAVQGHDNLLTLNQSSLEADTAGWTGLVNATIARSTAQSLDGAASLSLTANAAGDMGAKTTPQNIPITPGQAYIAVASVRAAVTARQFWVRLVWFQSDGTTLVSTSTGQNFADNAAGWRQGVVVAVAPTGAAFARLDVTIVSAAISEVHYVDRVAIIPLGSTDENGYGVNLLDGTDFEGGTDGWANKANATVAQTTAQAYVGRASLAATAIAGGIAAVIVGTPLTPTPGTSYAFSARVRAAATSRSAEARIDWYTAANAYISTTVGQGVADSTTGWVTVTAVGVAPATAAKAYPHVQWPGCVAGEVHYLDAPKVEVGSTATPYVPREWSNLITNPSFEADAAGWSPSNLTMTAPSSAWSAAGSGSLALAAWASTGDNYVSTNIYPTAATVTVSGTCHVPAVLTGTQDTRGRTITVYTYNAAGNIVGGYTSPAVTNAAGATGRVSVTVAVPAGGRLEVRLYNGSPTAGDVVQWDAVQAVYGNDPLPYIDGSSVGAKWNAAENLLPAATASFEDGSTGGWTAGANWTRANSAAQAVDGTKSLLCTRANGTAGNGYVTAGGYNVVAGVTYTATAWVRASAATGYTWVYADPGGTRVTTTFTAVANTWMRVAVTFTAVVSGTGGLLLTDDGNAAPTNGSTIYLDAVQVEQRDHATPYAAGATPNGTTSTKQATWTLGGWAATGNYVVEASENGGVTWTAVRGATPTSPAHVGSASTQQFTIYDYERTPGATVLYRARVSDGSGINQVTSPNSLVSTIIAAQTSWWIKDVYTPALNQALCDAQQNVRNRKGDSTAIYPAGRTNPLVLRGPVHGADGSFRTVVQTEAARTAALSLFTAQEPVLLQDPRGRQWYAEWVGDLTETPFRVDQPYYALQRSWVEVDVPS